MAAVTFVVVTRPNFIGAQAFNHSRHLVDIPALRVQATADLVCDQGTVTFADNSIEVVNATVFDGINPEPSVRLTSGASEPGPQHGQNGDEILAAITFTLSDIKIRAEVVVERRYNTMSLGGKKGPKGRFVAIPDYRARARATIACTHTEKVEGWQKSAGKWTAFTRDVPASTRTEVGQSGDKLFLKDAICGEVEPVAGTLYNSFEDVKIGSMEHAIT